MTRILQIDIAMGKEIDKDESFLRVSEKWKFGERRREIRVGWVVASLLTSRFFSLFTTDMVRLPFYPPIPRDNVRAGV